MSGRRVVAGVVAGVAAVVLAAAARGEELVLRLDPAASRLTFTLDATLHAAEGVIPLRSGEIRFDLASGAAAGEVVLDATRATTSNRDRDEKMHAKVLESDRFPTIVFRPTRIEAKEQGGPQVTVTLAGTVAIHGGEHPLALVATVRRDGSRVEARGTVTVPYVAWGMKDPSVFVLRVAKSVAVSFAAVGAVVEAEPAAASSGAPP